MRTKPFELELVQHARWLLGFIVGLPEMRAGQEHGLGDVDVSGKLARHTRQFHNVAAVAVGDDADRLIGLSP